MLCKTHGPGWVKGTFSYWSILHTVDRVAGIILIWIYKEMARPLSALPSPSPTLPVGAINLIILCLLSLRVNHFYIPPSPFSRLPSFVSRLVHLYSTSLQLMLSSALLYLVDSSSVHCQPDPNTQHVFPFFNSLMFTFLCPT